MSLDSNQSFANWRDAGAELASKLTRYAGRSDVVVLALPRGGVPVAFEVAEALGAELDISSGRLACPDTANARSEPSHPEVCACSATTSFAPTLWYRDFSETKDDEVRAPLRQRANRLHTGGHRP